MWKGFKELKTVTACLIILATIGLIGWDVYVAWNDLKGDTISEITMGWAMHKPFIPFITGIIIGHLLVPGTIKSWKEKLIKQLIMWPIVVGVFIWDLMTPPIPFLMAHPWVMFLAGAPLGIFLWKQDPEISGVK